jgi:SagB-type dehydrogenase family enzyme
MKKIVISLFAVLLSLPVLFPVTSHAARNEIILAKPDTRGGAPLMTALSKRQSSRSFSKKAIPDKVLSNLLWAASGINRQESGKRTAPSAVNKQEVDIYVALEEGLYLFNAKTHSLSLAVAKDLRPLTGRQGFVQSAPLNLIYVADLSRTAGESREDKILYAAADTGFIGQNVYLFCASEGLATIIRAFIDKETLGKAMNLKSSQMIILSQTVVYPGN